MRMDKALFGLGCPNLLRGVLFQFHHLASPTNRTCKNIFALLGWGGVALRCSPAKVSGRYHLDALNSAEKNQKKNKIQDNIICCTPSYHAKPLVNGLFATLSINIWVRCM